MEKYGLDYRPSIDFTGDAFVFYYSFKLNKEEQNIVKIGYNNVKRFLKQYLVIGIFPL